MPSVSAPVVVVESPRESHNGSWKLLRWFSQRNKFIGSDMERQRNIGGVSQFTVKNAGDLRLIPSPKLEPGDFISSALTASPIDMFSPVPVDLYSHTPKVFDKGYFKIWKLVEELAESERTYFSSLHLLLRYYISPLVSSRSPPSAVPLNMMGFVLKELLGFHSQFLERLQKECSKGQNHFELSYVLKAIKTVSANFYLYIDYCILYNEVLDLYRGDVSNNISFMSLPWLRGLSHFLEAAQPISRKHDLSFISLIQRPTARYGKYRLFLEAIVKQLQHNCSSSLYEDACSTLNLIKNKLEIIDRESSRNETRDKLTTLNEMVDFSLLRLPSRFFGSVLLSGCLNGVWIEGTKVKSSNFLLVLFKSHLLLCDNNVTRKKHLAPKFLITLSSCRLIDNIQDWNGGLFTTYSYSFKILFEKGHCQYEILFAAISKAESEIWQSQLSTLINFVNGPYKMDFSNADEETDTIATVPDTVSPFDISMKLQDLKKKSDCYFQASRTISIRNHIYPQPQLERNDLQSSDCTIDLTRFERIRSEKRLKSFWSSELPRVSLKHRASISRVSIFRSSSRNTLREPEPLSTSADVEDIDMMYTARTHVSSAASPPKLSRTSTVKSSLRRLFGNNYN